MPEYYLSIGANLGRCKENLALSMALLKEKGDITIDAVSSLYETAPWGKTDQPSFLNGAALVKTSLEPIQLLHRCQHIETALGRVRHEHWGARTIDLDLICSPGAAYHTEELILPHPLAIQRAFVLVPLVEISPAIELCGKTAAHWLEALGPIEGISKKYSPDDWYT